MSNAAMSSRCQYCDARNPYENHDAEYLTDRNPNNWWQSETMEENPRLHFNESVTLTLDLGIQFYVNYVYLMFKSPRPHAMIIHKKFSDTSPWTPWAYFSSNCLTYFNMSYIKMQSFERPDEVICREEYSTLQPLYDGEVIFNVIDERPGHNEFFQNEALQNWSIASQIKVELIKMHTFGDESIAEPDTLLTYYFAIRTFTVGGRCLCHGHASECQPVPGYGINPKLVCVCDPSHHTMGDNCEQCAPGFQDRPWKGATPEGASPCKACECNGNTDVCRFDQEEYERTGSGGVCINCQHNTQGKHCEQCLPGHYPHPDRPSICLPCNCDPLGTLDSSLQTCSGTGNCNCKPGVGGKRCDQCLPDFYSFTSDGCQSCGCKDSGSLDNKLQCDSKNGTCVCKENVDGQNCDRCKPGHFGLMRNDPLGCKKCYCNGHSSECNLGKKLDNQIVPQDEIELASLDEEDTVIFSCPNGTTACSVCLQEDKETLDIPCRQNERGNLECLCRVDANQCPFCTSAAWREPQPEIREEICECPPEYTGFSCEKCAPGYRRDPPGGPPTAFCTPCTCNNHSTTCSPVTGQCDCQHNTGGLFCDRCLDGFYGDAFAPPNTDKACQPCPCPAGSKCVQTRWPNEKPEVVCTDCPDNRTGVRCEKCAENFFGDPINGVPCKPCDCSGNTDLRAKGNCDSKTGECKKCLFGTTGSRCEKCLLGYRRNQRLTNQSLVIPGQPERPLIQARGCQLCQCDPRGTTGTGFCDEETGQCPCKPGVSGLRCEKCRTGFYDYSSGKGCKECECSAKGAKSEACDVYTGACTCLPNTMGRRCEECQPGYYNMTVGVGCSECGCHPYGSEDSQCGDDGQCPCRSFARGKKCDKCGENRHDLYAGCLPCPACYGLIQTRVNTLRKKLAEVFGGVDVNEDPTSDEELLNEIIKLNVTIQEMYHLALENNGVNGGIKDAEHLNSTVLNLLLRAEELRSELQKYIDHKPACIRSNILADLDHLGIEIVDLDRRIKVEGKPALENFKKVLDSSPHDAFLEEHAKNITETVNMLKEQIEGIYEYVKDSDSILRTVKDDTEDLRKDTSSNFNQLNSQLDRMRHLLRKQVEELKQKSEEINLLLRQEATTLQKLHGEIGKVPDVSSELSRLEEVMKKWTEMRNQFAVLKLEFETATISFDENMELLKRQRERLQSALAKQAPLAKLKEQIMANLEALLNRSETAVTEAQAAVDKAEQQLEDLKTFDEYVKQTKEELEKVTPMMDAIRKDINRLEKEVRNSQNQLTESSDTAKELVSKMESYRKQIESIKNGTENQVQQTADLMKKKERIDFMIFRQVDYEFQNSTAVFETVKPQADSLVQDQNKVSNNVKYLKKDMKDLLARMKDLMDKITKTGPELDIDSDGPVRFQALKKEWKTKNIAARMEALHRKHKSLSDELDYMRQELREFQANGLHLQRLYDLLPQTNECFYNQKTMEEKSPRFRRRSDKEVAYPWFRAKLTSKA